MSTVQSFFANIGNFFSNLYFSTNYLQAGAIVVLIFLLVLTLAQVRSHFVHWSLKGGLVGLFFGFILALIVEGFLLIAGRTAVTEILGWKNAPKPIKTALDLGHEKLVNVLGTSDQIPTSKASGESTVDDALTVLQSLNPNEIKKIKAIICTP